MKTKPLTKRTRMKQILESWKPKLPLQVRAERGRCGKGRPGVEPIHRFVPPGLWADRAEAACLNCTCKGCLSEAERKNMEAIALRLDGPDRVRNLQRFMSEYEWDESWMRRTALGACRRKFERRPGSLEHRCLRISQKGRSLGRSGPAVLWGAGQDGQLPVGRLHLLLQPQGPRAFGQPALLARVLV